MRKIKLLLVTVFALISMSAFAVFPDAGTQGYFYNEATGLFMTGKAEVTLVAKADVTNADIYNVWYKNASENNGQNIRFSTSAASPWTSLRYNEQKLVVGDDGYCKWGLATAADGSFTLYYPSNYSAYGPTGYLTVDPKTKTFTATAEATAYSRWRFMTQDEFDALKVFPDAGTQGYFYNAASGLFMTGKAEVTLVAKADITESDIYNVWYKNASENNGQNVRFSTSAAAPWTSLRYNEQKLVVGDDGYCKWGLATAADGSFTLYYPSNYSAYGPTGYLTVDPKTKTFTATAEATEYSKWQFLTQKQFEAIVVSIEEEPEKKFPDAGVEGYLYNPASGKFIDANGAPSVIGVKYAVYRKSTDNKDTDIRFGNPSDPANKHLRINEVNPVLQTNDPYYSKWGYEVKDDGKFLLKAGYDYAYGCTKGNYLTIKADGTIEYVATATDASYWQFVDQETYEKLVSTPVYYLKNAESGLFFGGENNWGTRGTLSARGDLFKLVKYADGEYAIQNTLVSINDNKLGSNIYVDNAGAKGGWTITNVGDGKYTIYNAEVVSGGYLAQGTEQLAKGYAAVGVADVTDAAKWYILTKEEAVAQMGTATVENPLPATFLIKNPGFNRNYSTADWKMEASNQNLCGGTDENKCAESYHANFTLTQTIEGVPNGVYVLTAQGFYRQDGGNNDDLPVFYGNQMTGKFPLKTGTENSMNDASGSFKNGLYTIDPIYVQVTNNKLTVGAKLAGNTSLWCIWDNFQLSYIGNADAANEIAVNAGKKLFDEVVAEAKALATAEMNEELRGDLKELIAEIEGETFTTQRGYVLEAEYVLEAIQDAKASAAIYADYRAAIAAARAIFPETMPADKLVALDKAIKDYPESKVLVDGATDASINEAATAIWAAYNDAANFVNSGSALMGMYELMEHNNVVTPKAYETYFNKFEALSKQWQAGTLAEAVVNPYNLNGWHANLDYDDYLLSTWTVGGEQAQNYDKALYINTWSTEGEGDGTDFKVPFFEYWTGDANSLGKNELVATLNDIEPGIYEVSAWVRVRAKNGTAAADATGITLQLNDGDAVDVTEGDAVGQFNLAEYVAEGEVEEGTLKVKFTVAEGNNISWLSFQNVKYTKTGDIATAISEVGNKATAKTIFNVAGQQMNGLQKGLNIVDGKKVYIK